jgi:predicted dinucleotide-binding enzyme
MAAYWTQETGEWADLLNPMQKSVASRTLKGGSVERNGTVIEGDAVEGVPRLKTELDVDLFLIGCAELARTLIANSLVDELGSGSIRRSGGNMGRAIATRTIAGGHEVEIVDRDPAEAKKLADELGGSPTALEPDAAFGGEVVVFAPYYPGIKDAVRQYADRPGGKVVVDISNPVDTETWDRLATEPGSSSAEEIARSFRRAPVVKAFNTNFAKTLVPGEVDGQRLDVYLAGTATRPRRKSRSSSRTAA